MTQGLTMQGRRLTWLAVILTFVFLVPGEVIGSVVAYFYRMILEGFLGGDSLLDLVTKGWASVILIEIISNGIRGGVAGVGATIVCAKLLKNADYNVVAYTNSALVIVFTIIGLIASVQKGMNMDDLAMIANTVGLVIGLFGMAKQASLPVAAAPAPEPGL